MFDIDGKKIMIQLWDTAGSERFKSITWTYFKGAQGVIFVYDVTNRKSFQEIQTWLTDVEKAASPDVVKLLIGNKCDQSSERVIAYADAQEFAEHYKMHFIETSAKHGTNIKEAF